MKIEAERLPDLNVPRSGHSLLLVNGEPTVIGGHTTNFKPTTATWLLHLSTHAQKAAMGNSVRQLPSWDGHSSPLPSQLWQQGSSCAPM